MENLFTGFHCRVVSEEAGCITLKFRGGSLGAEMKTKSITSD